MIEQAKFRNYPLLESVRIKRDQLDLERIDIDLLRAQVGSQDPTLASNAQRLLRIKWDLDPGQDAQHATSIDISEQLEPFSQDELKVMFKNLVGVQLTEGCNGNCPFCMFGNKKGVTAKYSYDSLETLFHEKSDMMIGHPFVLYWDSDPFDYRDGNRSFVDVYKLYRETLPNHSHYISTAMPRGGEADFIKFMTYLASVLDTSEGVQFPIRLSLTQHNIQRVEATLEALTIHLLEEGYSKTDINKLYTHVPVVRRFDNFLLPIGPFIHRADDIKNTFSTACRDGIIVTPKSCQAIMMTAATIYEPSGQKNVELIPGQVSSQIPRKVSDERYAIQSTFDEKTLTDRTNERRTMIPVIKHANEDIYALDDDKEDSCLKLGREVASLTRLIHNFSAAPRLDLDSPDSAAEKRDYLKVCTEVFRERQNHTQSLISDAEHFCNSAVLSDEERTQIQYYILLTQVHLAKMDFLADQVEQGQSLSVVSNMALILSEVGRKQLDRLPAILNALSDPTTSEPLKLSRLDYADIQLFLDDIQGNHA